MNPLLRKYLDGELNEDEVQRFLDEIESDPAMKAELEAHERIVDLGSRRPPVEVSDSFADDVMEAVRSASSGSFAASAAAAKRPWNLNWPVAASLVLAVGVGYLLANAGGGLNDGRGDTATLGIPATVVALPEGGAAAGLQPVRLVFHPQGTAVDRIAVAGTFNGWNPSSTPMHRENGHWAATLLLPTDSYEYMFVIDDTTWVTDPFALTTRDDGFGNRNAILEVGI